MKQLLCTTLAALLLLVCTLPALAAPKSEVGKIPKTVGWATSNKTDKTDKTDKQAVDEDWMLQLVNRENPLAETFVPEYEEVQNSYMMDQRVAPILRQMIADARDAGVELVLNSAYRPYSSQQRIYNAKIQEYLSMGYSAENAKIMTELYVAIPGHSEHQLGLAADIVAVSYPMLDSGYAATDAAKWLAVNAPQYGFILRYPQDKTEITHTAFEPWHFRYVGKTAAKAITGQGLCLEEYLIIKAKNDRR